MQDIRLEARSGYHWKIDTKGGTYRGYKIAEYDHNIDCWKFKNDSEQVMTCIPSENVYAFYQISDYL